MDNEFSDYKNVAVVSTFDQLIHSDFRKGKNAICWYRNLTGDFAEVVSKLQLEDNLTEISLKTLKSLQLAEEGNKAREIIVKDFNLLIACGAGPSLNLIKNYQRDDELDFISTDVYSFHVDRSPVGSDTYLCTYYGVASEIVANDEAEQKILIPEIRRKLKAFYDGPEEEFETFLVENYFDLHYQARPNAQPLNIGLGHIWRLAVDHPEKEVLPCIHRAPVEKDGEYRLLMIC